MTNDLHRITRAKSSSSAKAVSFWLLFMVDAFILGVSTAQLQYRLYFNADEFSVWFGLFIASGLGLIVLVWRTWRHDTYQTDVIERMTVTPEEDPAPWEQPVYQVQQIREGGRHIVFGTLKLTESEWQNLAATIKSNDGRVVRDIVASAGVFQNITRNWPSIYAEMERLGWVANNQLTNAGYDWLDQFIPPSPSQNGAPKRDTNAQRQRRPRRLSEVLH